MPSRKIGESEESYLKTHFLLFSDLTIIAPFWDFAFKGPRALLPAKIGSLTTDVREPRAATGSRVFPFLAWFCFLPLT